MFSKTDLEYIAICFKINGIVQGVGFRPFVYQQAKKFRLNGHVANTSRGVFIHVEGNSRDIACFENSLKTELPSLALITEIEKQNVNPINPDKFTIIQSHGNKIRTTMISPDVSICRGCLNELNDPLNRRFGYPFINCTNCGPRYTIIHDIPYDRPKTSMKHFTMCDACLAEYNNPSDRRFHAQPNCCADCGPGVTLHDKHGDKIEAENLFETAAQFLSKGYCMAIKGLGGFHLAVDASNSRAVEKLRCLKKRGEKPFALMCVSLEEVSCFARISSGEKDLLTSYSAPIVLLRKKEKTSVNISRDVAPNNKYIGVMLPYTPLHHLLFKYDVASMVMTSGNHRDEPIAIDNEAAFETLSIFADFFLMHNRDIYLRGDDSVVRKNNGSEMFLRRSRGYVPAPVLLKAKVPQILACGGEMKNTVCLVKENKACLSQHIGELDNPAAFDFFQMTINHLKKILDINPEVIAHDIHPDYMSTQYAKEQIGVDTVAVQHHHAHIVSVMAENSLDEPVIGLAFDGTGFGIDDNIWGSEVLIAQIHDFKRAAHLEYVPIPGGESAIREPWRMAVSYLFYAFGDDMYNLDIPIFREGSGRAMDREKVRFISQMVEKKINSPLTSSMGRLFDGVSSIIGLCNVISYEAEAAIRLEMAADNGDVNPYDLSLLNQVADGVMEIEIKPLIRAIARDVENRIPVSVISSKFHQTLVSIFSNICISLRQEYELNKVVMSGGVFQNVHLLSGLTRELKKNSFEVFINRVVPANDGGLSLGQAVVAAGGILEL